MSTLVYAPGIRVQIERKDGSVLDISKDIANAEIALTENGVHWLSFDLQNAQRKYDGQFFPNDSVTVQLKRFRWLQIMSGYLNSSPIFQAWPAVLPISASCSLKLPQYWAWDPTTSDALTLISEAIAMKSDAAVDGAGGGGNLTQVVRNVLTRVTGWDPQHVHIGKIPERWFEAADKVGGLIAADTDMSAVLGAGGMISGSEGTLQVNLPAGTYGGSTIDAVQAHNISIVYNTVKFGQKLTDRYVLIALMVVATESGYHNWASPAAPGSTNYPNDGVQSPDSTSCGLFQQKPEYWGGVASCMNPVSATGTFIEALKKVMPTPSIIRDDWVIAQDVQGSNFDDPNNYGVNYKAQAVLAKALLDACNAVSAGTTPTAGEFGANPNPAGTPVGGAGTGSNVAQVAVALINSNPMIQYSGAESGYQDDRADKPNPIAKLDCSSLIDMVYYRATGTWLSGSPGQRTSTGSQTGSGRVVRIPLDLALHVQGAALYAGWGSASHHVGISLGDGDTHVAAHTADAPPGKQVDISSVKGSGFTDGGLLPSIDYTAAGTTADAARDLTQYVGRPTSVSTVTISGAAVEVGTGVGATGAGTTDTALAGLINSIVFGPTTSTLGNTLGGARALMNDSYLLPWLSNVVKASMRSFCSAPNGDFISWFPDYFGLWGTAGAVDIEPIELQDLTVMWLDDSLVTHQYVIGDPSGVSVLDQTSGSLGSFGGYDQAGLLFTTSGIATMDYPEIFDAIYGKTANKDWVHNFLLRFGARPDTLQIPQIPSGKPEFFMALYTFMRRWAGQFRASVPLTFMPELFPGMLLRVPEYKFQAYVTAVRHSIRFGPGGGFTTTADIIAPVNTGSPDRSDLLQLLPQGGTPFAS